MTAISKSMYIDAVDEIVNKYINTYYRTFKRNLSMSSQVRRLTLMLGIMAQTQLKVDDQVSW